MSCVSLLDALTARVFTPAVGLVVCVPRTITIDQVKAIAGRVLLIVFKPTTALYDNCSI